MVDLVDKIERALFFDNDDNVFPAKVYSDGIK